jgi:hypothetical protein
MAATTETQNHQVVQKGGVTTYLHTCFPGTQSPHLL